MKLVKKLLTSFCALAIATTAMSSFAIMASAEGEVTAVPVITVDEEAKTVDIEVHVKNVPATVDGSAQYVTYAVASVDVSSFSTVDLSALGEDDYFDWEDAHFEKVFSNGSPIIGQDNTMPGYFAYQLKFDTGTLAKNAAADVTADMVLFKLNDLPLSDEALANGFEVKLRGITNDLGFAIGTAKRGNYNNTSLYKCNTSVAGAPTAVLETATWAPEGGNDEPTTATVVGDTLVGDKTVAGNDDESDKAVAIFGTPVAPAAHSTSLVWTVTNTSDVTKTFTQAVDVEGGATYNFGLVLRNITKDLVKSVSAAFAQ